MHTMKFFILMPVIFMFSLSTAIGQIIFYKQIDFGALSHFWSATEHNPLSSIENSLKGCWRAERPIYTGPSIGGGLFTITPVFTLEAFPIPSGNSIPIRIPEVEANSRVMILNLEGEVIYEEMLSQRETIMDITELAFGYYIVQYQGQSHSWKLPLIKQ